MKLNLVPYQDMKLFERMINHFFSKDFPWWKKMTINELGNRQRGWTNQIVMNSSVIVEPIWAFNQFKKYHPNKPFNVENLTLGDLLGMKESQKVSDEFVYYFNLSGVYPLSQGSNRPDFFVPSDIKVLLDDSDESIES